MPPPPLPLKAVVIVHCHHHVLHSTILYHIGKICFPEDATVVWILNEDENHSCHVKFMVFQNTEFTLGSLWCNFLHPDDDFGWLGPLIMKWLQDSHYNLIQSNGLVDLVLMPIRVLKSSTTNGAYMCQLFWWASWLLNICFTFCPLTKFDS